MTADYYERLDVSPDADQSDIEKRWREAVKEKHPDQNDDPNAQQQFIQLKEAYDVLSDPEQRARYDELGHDEFVDDRQRTSTTESQSAYQRSRADDADSASEAGESAVDWRANTRGHPEAEHVWKAGSGPSADTAPPTHTSDASTGRRAVAYGSLTIIPGFLSPYLVTGVLGAPVDILTSAGLVSVIVVTMYLLIVGSEALLDTDRRLWTPW